MRLVLLSLALASLWSAGAWQSASTPTTNRFLVQPRGDTPWVDIALPQTEGALTVRLPELISDTDRRLVYSEQNLKSGIRWQPRPGGTMVSQWRQEGLAAYDLVITPQPDGLQLDWTITNLESVPWPRASGTVCMQSHSVASLFDSTGERIYLRGGNKWVTAASTWKQLGGNWYLPPGVEPLNILKPYIENGSWKVSDFRPDQAVMAVRSRDGQWLLAQAWHRASFLIANVHGRYACTDVSPDLGDLGPGQTVVVRGKIYYFRGSLDDLAHKYAADLESGKLGLQRAAR